MWNIMDSLEFEIVYVLALKKKVTNKPYKPITPSIYWFGGNHGLQQPYAIYSSKFLSYSFRNNDSCVDRTKGWSFQNKLKKL